MVNEMIARLRTRGRSRRDFGRMSVSCSGTRRLPFHPMSSNHPCTRPSSLPWNGAWSSGPWARSRSVTWSIYRGHSLRPVRRDGEITDSRDGTAAHPCVDVRGRLGEPESEGRAVEPVPSRRRWAKCEAVERRPHDPVLIARSGGIEAQGERVGLRSMKRPQYSSDSEQSLEI